VKLYCRRTGGAAEALHFRYRHGAPKVHRIRHDVFRSGTPRTFSPSEASGRPAGEALPQQRQDCNKCRYEMLLPAARCRWRHALSRTEMSIRAKSGVALPLEPYTQPAAREAERQKRMTRPTNKEPVNRRGESPVRRKVGRQKKGMADRQEGNGRVGRRLYSKTGKAGCARRHVPLY